MENQERMPVSRIIRKLLPMHELDSNIVERVSRLRGQWILLVAGLYGRFWNGIPHTALMRHRPLNLPPYCILFWDRVGNWLSGTASNSEAGNGTETGSRMYPAGGGRQVSIRNVTPK